MASLLFAAFLVTHVVTTATSVAATTSGVSLGTAGAALTSGWEGEAYEGASAAMADGPVAEGLGEARGAVLGGADESR